jgi:hypothetical protein
VGLHGNGKGYLRNLTENPDVSNQLYAENVSKTNSFESTISEGNAKVSGSAEDYGFWKIDSVTVRCNDTKELHKNSLV